MGGAEAHAVAAVLATNRCAPPASAGATVSGIARGADRCAVAHRVHTRRADVPRSCREDLHLEAPTPLRLIFHLPLRQTEGSVTSIFGMLGRNLSAPDHTTRSRRGRHLDLPLRRAPAGAGMHLIVDSTGLSIVGEGAWAAVTCGGRGRRGWKKLHLDVDRSGVIVARALTEASVDDATTSISRIVRAIPWRPSTVSWSRETPEPLRLGVLLCRSWVRRRSVPVAPPAAVQFQPANQERSER